MSNLNSSLEVLFNKMEGLVSSKTVIGEPINIGDVIIVPLVDIAVGVGAGSAEKRDTKNENSGGGLGAKISPTAILVIQNGGVQLVDVKNQNSMNKIIDMVPGIVSKLGLGSFFNPGEDETAEEATTENTEEQE